MRERKGAREGGIRGRRKYSVTSQYKLLMGTGGPDYRMPSGVKKRVEKKDRKGNSRRRSRVSVFNAKGLTLFEKGTTLPSRTLPRKGALIKKRRYVLAIVDLGVVLGAYSVPNEVFSGLGKIKEGRR